MTSTLRPMSLGEILDRTFLIYYDQRIQHEGFDIEWMMQAAGMKPPQPAGRKQSPARFGKRRSGQRDA